MAHPDYYTRTVPATWSEGNNDLLMQSVIANYAVEGRGDDGQPNGKFFLTRDGWDGIAHEVIETHLGFTGEKAADYAAGHIQKIWDHYDVLKKGFLLANEVPQCLRMLLGEVEINNALQVQLEEQGALANYSQLKHHKKHHKHHRKPKNNNNVQYRPNAVQSPWSVKPDPAATTAITGAFTIADMAHPDFYERVVPDAFSEGKDDLLMNSVIQKYSVEGKGADGNPNGQFWVTRNLFDDLSAEVIQTHLGFTGEKAATYANERVGKIWDHFDLLKKGFLHANEMPQCMRMLVGEVEINNGLQVQLSEEGELAYRPNGIQSPWSVKPDPAAKTPITDAFTVNDMAHPDYYQRTVPDRFSEGKDDLLMNSVISKYALEGKADDGHPNG